jgi:hypothetical protein
MTKRRRKVTRARRLLDKADRADKYPNCQGSFDTCPAEEIADPKTPAQPCLKCPVYAESRYYQPPKLEMDELALSLFKREEKPETSERKDEQKQETAKE